MRSLVCSDYLAELIQRVLCEAAARLDWRLLNLHMHTEVCWILQHQLKFACAPFLYGPHHCLLFSMLHDNRYMAHQ